MTMSSLKHLNVLLIAEENIGLRVFKLVLESEHRIRGVLTTYSTTYSDEADLSSGSVNSKKNSEPIVALATKLGIPVWSADYVTNPYFAIWLRSNAIDVLLNVHALHRVHSDILEATQIGGFNLHPGPLPEYSGMNMPSWAVFNQEESFGVTIHRITDRIDAGQIAYETRFPITPTDTGLSVSLKCVSEGLKLIKRLLYQLSVNPMAIPCVAQNLTNRIVYKRNDIPNNGFISWSETADKINAFIRACNFAPYASPWGTPKTRLSDKLIEIHSMQVTDQKCDASPGTIGCINKDNVNISTGDLWTKITQCKLNGVLLPANKVFHVGDVLN